MIGAMVGENENRSDVLVIGGGPGGYHAAACAARSGKQVTLIEEGPLGGVCLNAGCIPSKALIQGARCTDPFPFSEAHSVDFSRLQAWKGEIVARLQRGVQQILRQADVTVVQGRAAFSGRYSVTVATGSANEVYWFRHCIIATGSSPVELPGFRVDGERIIDSTGALGLTAIPERLLVLGGGYVGLELGTAYAKLGSQVSVLEAADRLLPGMDPDLSRIVHRRLEQLGVKIYLNTRALSWSEKAGQAFVTASVGGQETEVPATRILVAVGRRPNTAGLGLETAGIAVDERGFIRTDHSCRTSVPGVYAIGDVVGGLMLAHKATHEAEVAVAAIAGRPIATGDTVIPAVVFTDPEVASVGLTEAEARQRGYTPVTGRVSMAAIGRALIAGDTEGFVKVVADEESGRLLGVQMAGPEVSELIAIAALALKLGARVEEVAATVHPHPTLSESLQFAAAAAASKIAAQHHL